MKLFRTHDYLSAGNPQPQQPFRPEILTASDGAKELGGMFGILPAGAGVPYHFHQRRESIVLIIGGEAIELIEGKEIPVGAGDLLYIPAGEKHTMINRSDREVRYLEFFTAPPLSADFVEVGERS